MIKSHLYAIFSLILSNIKINTDISLMYKSDRLKPAIQYIQSNYKQKIYIDELSKMVHMSEGHFCRYFKKIVMKTPIEYLNHIRIIKACELLKNSDRKVIDIAMDVGFSSFSYFINIFKRCMKLTPAKYRKEHQT